MKQACYQNTNKYEDVSIQVTTGYKKSNYLRIKKGFVFISILLVLFNCCRKGTTYKERFTLVADTDRIEIEISKRSKNYSQCIQYMIVNDISYLLVHNTTRNSIEIYNLETRKLFKEIVIKKEGPNSFFRSHGFIAKNMDTIIVICQSPQLVGLINGNGEVLKKISYSKDVNGKKLKPAGISFGSRPILIGDTLFLSQNYRTDESLGILTTEKQKYSYLHAKVDLITGECRMVPLIYPVELIGRDISNTDICRVLGYNGCLVYNFGIEKDLFLSKNKINFEKKTFETNYQLKLPENQWRKITSIINGAKYKITRDEVQEIFYDRYRECYYVFTRKREEELEKNPDFRTKFVYPNCIITILDKELKHMGDVYLPDNTYCIRMSFITPKGLYMSEDHINNPAFSEDYMRLRLFTLENTNNKK